MREVTEVEMMALAQSIKPGGANALGGASASALTAGAAMSSPSGAPTASKTAGGTTNALTNGIAQPVQSLALTPSSKSPGGATLAAPPASFAAPVGGSAPAMISSAMATPLSQGSASFRANGPLGVPYRDYSVMLGYRAPLFAADRPGVDAGHVRPNVDFADLGPIQTIGNPAVARRLRQPGSRNRPIYTVDVREVPYDIQEVPWRPDAGAVQDRFLETYTIPLVGRVATGDAGDPMRLVGVWMTC